MSSSLALSATITSRSPAWSCAAMPSSCASIVRAAFRAGITIVTGDSAVMPGCPTHTSSGDRASSEPWLEEELVRHREPLEEVRAELVELLGVRRERSTLRGDVRTHVDDARCERDELANRPQRGEHGAPPVRPNKVLSPISFASSAIWSTVTGKPHELIVATAVAGSAPTTPSSTWPSSTAWTIPRVSEI